MKSINLIFLIIILGFSAHAQVPDTVWTRTYGGPFNDFAHSVDISFQDDYIVAGQTYSLESGSYDIYLIRINSGGDTLWSKTYGGIYSEYGNCVIRTSDSGFAVVGETRSFGAGSYDVYFLKTDAIGDTLWAKTYGGDDYEKGWSVCQTSDGGYIIAGSTRSFGTDDDDVYLVRTDSAGDTLWSRTYGGSYHDCGYSVLQTPDEGFIIAGETDSFGADTMDAYIIRTNASGDTLWARTFGGAEPDIVYAIRPTSDAGYILAGTTESFGAGMIDWYLLKMNDSGDTLWTRTYGGADKEYIGSVQQTPDDGFILAGCTESFGSVNKDLYIIKTDSIGNMIWSGNYGGPGDDIAASIRQTSDGGYIIAGATTSYGAGNHDVYIVKLRSDQTPVEDKGLPLKPDNYLLCSNFPNPFNSSTTIEYSLAEASPVKIEIYDLLGRKVKTLADEEKPAGIHTIIFNAFDLSSGIYFYRLQAGDMDETGRMLLLK